MRPREIRPGIRRLFRLAVRRPDRTRDDADEEIRLHLVLRTEQLMREGWTREAACVEAERRFGSVEEARRHARASAAQRERRWRAREWVDAAWRSVRLSVRGLRRAPGFVGTVVTCMALGVGANSAAFSLFDELVLRPLPVPAPERLVNLAAPGPQTGSTQCNRIGDCDEVFSYPMFRDLQRGQTVFTGIAAHRLFIAGVAYDGQAVEGDGVLVSGSYFPVLGLRPALGRLLGPADDQVVGGHPVAVLSHAYWTARLGADPGVLGRRIVVNDRPLTIVGVAPRGFEGTTLGVRPAVFVPLTMAAEVDIGFGSRAQFDDRLFHGIFLFARLRPGVTLERARTAMNAVYRPILADREASLQRGMSAATMARFRARELAITSGAHGQSVLRGTTRTPLILLFAITGVVVLIACANIANLLLVRGTGRAAEIAVRTSLGASRRQLVAQLLTESCLLAVLGGVASLLVARATLALAASFVPAATLGMGTALALDLRPSVLAFSAAVALGIGLLFGLFPALHATRPDLMASVRAGAGQIAGGRRAAARVRASLVTAQIALSMALLVAAGLLVQSLRNVSRVDLGLQVDHVVTFALVPALNGYDPARTRTLLERVEEELATLPGVTAVGGASMPLLTGMSNGNNVRVEGFERGPDVDANTRVNEVGPGYLRALGIPLLAGREFTARDRLGAPKVAIVNEAFARKFGLGRAAVGKRMATDGHSPDGVLDIEIVGLMRDATYGDVKGEPPPLFITPYRQDSAIAGLAFYVKTSLPPERLLRSIPAAVARLDPTLPVAMLKTMPQQVRDNIYLDRMIGTLSAGFAALATLLAAVGLYGVLAYTVAQRTREIGVRMALGADSRRIRRMVLREVARLTLVGAVVGIAGAFALGHAAQSLLFGLDGRDPLAFAGAAGVLALVTFGAGALPAWRASRVEPMRALRE
ncbi:MAG TPA: ABC transporter permease [Gemmatimonadaceae bacterium]|nr:ABC transporter permease [Gemmatimonadaceae bacterium]